MFFARPIFSTAYEPWADKLRFMSILLTTRASSTNSRNSLLIAVNYILPVRLGELFRRLLKCRFRIQDWRQSIAIERLSDGIIVICFLWFGLVLATRDAEFHTTEQLWPIAAIAKIGTAIFIATIACMFLIVRYRIRLAIGPE
jgi:hypothetical protein